MSQSPMASERYSGIPRLPLTPRHSILMVSSLAVARFYPLLPAAIALYTLNGKSGRQRKRTEATSVESSNPSQTAQAITAAREGMLPLVTSSGLIIQNNSARRVTEQRRHSG